MHARSAGVFASVLLIWLLPGCPQAPILEHPVVLDLGEDLGVFEVEAGAIGRNWGVARIDAEGLAPLGGSLTIGLDDVEVAFNGTAPKGSVSFHEGDSLEIAIRIAPAEELDTVCEQGERYGPLHVDLDAFYVPVSVEPESVALVDGTLDLLTSGDFSICIELISPVSTVVTVQAITFRLRL